MTDLFHTVDAIAPWFAPTMVGVFGACIGSFLNVCIHRIPRSESIVTPGSHCACGRPIAWFDNLPVLSWFILRGRARCCGRPFSFRYAFVEMLTAALFVACWLQFPSGKAIAGMLLCALLIAATFIDLDHLIIPDAFTIGGTVAGVLLAVLLPDLHGQSHEFAFVAGLRAGRDAVVGALIGSGLVLWIALLAEFVLKKEAMGFGDVKLLGAIGAFVGWKGAVFSVFGGAMIGCAWFVVALAWQKVAGKSAPAALKAETPDGQPADIGFGVHVPFGPMLAAGGLFYFLAMHRWVDAYFAGLSVLF
jgi:leader peptidase (prepilin peptidase)/N-methyltransferase